MFIGHAAVAFVGKKAAPKTSLGMSLFAVYFLDLLWPIFLILGLEQVKIVPGLMRLCPFDFVYPYSHSLLAAGAWAALISLGYYALTRYLRGAAWLWLAVISHWFLDAVVHRPDLPLIPGGNALIGLGLWNSAIGTLTVEGGLFLAGLWMYLRSTKAKDRTGDLALWSFVLVLVAIYFGSLFGPPPPNVPAVEAAGLGLWLIPLWGFWIDCHRETLPA